jgi:adenylate cyclase
VLFSDIRGFTGMSEGMGPRDLLMMLDDYFGRMSQVVKGHDGVVGKFIGDGLLAFWGVPDAVPDHAVRAVRAARDMRGALRELNQQRTKDGASPIKIEGLTKEHGVDVLLSETTWAQLGGGLPARKLAEDTIRGRKMPVVLYALEVEGADADAAHAATAKTAQSDP